MPNTDTLRACHDCLEAGHTQLYRVSAAVHELVSQRHLSRASGKDFLLVLQAQRAALVVAARLLRKDLIVSHLSRVINALADLRRELEVFGFDRTAQLVGSARECVRDARGPLTVIHQATA